MPLPASHVEFIDYGYLCKRHGGDLHCHARQVTRSTAGFAPGCMPLATPGRIAAHTRVIPRLVDPEAAKGVLLIAPAYQRTADRGLAGAQVVVQRLQLHPEHDRADRPGEACRSHAIALDWMEWGHACPHAARYLGALQATRIAVDAPPSERLDLAPRPLMMSAANHDGADPFAVDVLAGAIMAGRRLRLGQAWFEDEDAFLAGLTAALARLPGGMRGHVSASAGLVEPDDGFQIAWWPGAEDLQKGHAAARWLAQLGSREIPSTAFDDVVADDGATPERAGLVVQGRAEESLQSDVRRQIASRLLGEEPEAADLAGWAPHALPPVAARRLVDALRQDPRATLRTSFEINGNMAFPGRVLGAATAAAATLTDVAAAADLLHACDRPWTLADRKSLDCMAERVRRVWAERACPRPDDLATVMASPGLRRLVAERVRDGDALLTESLRRAFVILAVTGGSPDADAVRMAGTLLPRTVAGGKDWNDLWTDEAAKGRILRDVPTSDASIDEDTFAALALSCVRDGRWDVVRDCLVNMVSRLGREPYAAGERPEPMVTRLRMISALGRALETAAPASGVPDRPAQVPLRLA